LGSLKVMCNLRFQWRWLAVYLELECLVVLKFPFI
jgi:hypothetical protein